MSSAAPQGQFGDTLTADVAFSAYTDKALPVITKDLVFEGNNYEFISATPIDSGVTVNSNSTNGCNVSLDFSTVSATTKTTPKRVISHTPNLDDNGNITASATPSSQLDLCRIPGATKLHVAITYSKNISITAYDREARGADGGVSNDGIKVFTHTKNSSSSDVVTEEFDVNSDTVQFYTFDMPTDAYGYYAIVTDPDEANVSSSIKTMSLRLSFKSTSPDITDADDDGEIDGNPSYVYVYDSQTGSEDNPEKSSITLSWIENSSANGYSLALSFISGRTDGEPVDGNDKFLKYNVEGCCAKNITYSCTVTLSSAGEAQSAIYEPGMLEIRLPYVAFYGNVTGAYKVEANTTEYVPYNDTPSDKPSNDIGKNFRTNKPTPYSIPFSAQSDITGDYSQDFYYEIDEINNELVIKNYRRISPTYSLTFPVQYKIFAPYIADMSIFNIYAHGKGKSTTDTNYITVNIDGDNSLNYQLDTGISFFQKTNWLDWNEKTKDASGIAYSASQLNNMVKRNENNYYGFYTRLLEDAPIINSDSEYIPAYRGRINTVPASAFDFENKIYLIEFSSVQLISSQGFSFDLKFSDKNFSGSDFKAKYCLVQINDSGYDSRNTCFTMSNVIGDTISNNEFKWKILPQIWSSRLKFSYTEDAPIYVNSCIVFEYDKNAVISSGLNMAPVVDYTFTGVVNEDTHVSPDTNDIAKTTVDLFEFPYIEYSYPTGQLYNLYGYNSYFGTYGVLDKLLAGQDVLAQVNDTNRYMLYLNSDYDANVFQDMTGYKHKSFLFLDGIYLVDTYGESYTRLTSEDYYFSNITASESYSCTDIHSGDITFSGNLGTIVSQETIDGAGLVGEAKFMGLKDTEAEWECINSIPATDGTGIEADSSGLQDYIGIGYETFGCDPLKVTTKITPYIYFKASSPALLNKISALGIGTADMISSMGSLAGAYTSSIGARIYYVYGLKHYHSIDGGSTWIEDLHFPDCYDSSKGGVMSGDPNIAHNYNEWWSSNTSNFSSNSSYSNFRDMVYEHDISTGFCSGYKEKSDPSDPDEYIYTSGGIPRFFINDTLRSCYRTKSEGISTPVETVNKQSRRLDYTFQVYDIQHVEGDKGLFQEIYDTYVNHTDKYNDFKYIYDALVCNYLKFYVLLPKDYIFDNFSITKKYFWSDSFSDSLGNPGEVMDYELRENYKNSGSTLLIVKIKPEDLNTAGGSSSIYNYLSNGASIQINMHLNWEDAPYHTADDPDVVRGVCYRYYDDPDSVGIGSMYSDVGFKLAYNASTSSLSSISYVNDKYMPYFPKSNSAYKSYNPMLSGATFFGAQISKTSNVSDDGTILTRLSDDELNYKDTIHISGAQALLISVKGNLDYSNLDYSASGLRIGTTPISDEMNFVDYDYNIYCSNYKGFNSSYVIPGDTAYFFLKQSSSSSKYGYYATVQGIKDIPFYDADGDGRSKTQNVSSMNCQLFYPAYVGAIESCMQLKVAGLKNLYQNENITNLSSDIKDAFYSYRLSVLKSEGHVAKDIVLYDILEDAVPDGKSGWKGTFENVDTTYLESLGITPTIYYSTTPGLTYPVFQDSATRDTWYQDTSVWSTTMPANKVDITAVAIDLGNYEIPDNKSVYTIINMKAPTDDPRDTDPDAEYAYNQAACSWFTDIMESGSPSYSLLSGSIVKVGLSSVNIAATKKWSDASNWWEDRPESIQVTLLANGTQAEGTTTQTLNALNNWTYTFNHMPVLDDLGGTIDYSIEEVETTGYTTYYVNDADDITSLLADYDTSTRYVHTSNVSDEGVKNTDYSNNLQQKDVVTVPGATSLHISLTYGTENNYDWVIAYKGEYSGDVPSAKFNDSAVIAIKNDANYCNGGTGATPASPLEFDVEGDTVTFLFRSDSSSSGFGYYAIISPEINNIPIISTELADQMSDPSMYNQYILNVHNNNPNDIYFGKFDTDDRTESTPLSGAIFNLEYWNPGSDVTSTADTTSTYTSDTYDLQSLSDGYYKLTEQTPVPNYGIVPPIFFTIKNGLITLDEPARTDAVTSTHDSKVMLSIFDTPLAELSSTGGSGVGTFTVFGLAIMITCGIILYHSKEKYKFLH